MFSMKQLIILSAMVCVAYCAVGRIGNSKSETKDGYCEYEGVFIKRGESAKIGEDCVAYNCLDDYEISIFS